MSDFIALSTLLKSPLLIFILCVLVLLGWVIFSLLKTIKSQIEYERELVHELSESSNTLARLTALIEILVHGKGGPR